MTGYPCVPRKNGIASEEKRKRNTLSTQVAVFIYISLSLSKKLYNILSPKLHARTLILSLSRSNKVTHSVRFSLSSLFITLLLPLDLFTERKVSFKRERERSVVLFVGIEWGLLLDRATVTISPSRSCWSEIPVSAKAVYSSVSSLVLSMISLLPSVLTHFPFFYFLLLYIYLVCNISLIFIWRKLGSHGFF